MTFTDLELLAAVHLAKPRGNDHPTDAKRLMIAREVQEAHALHYKTTFFPFTIDDVLTCVLNYRKNLDVRIKAEIVLTHGARCFWRDRDKGPCDDQAEMGHLIPNCKGGAISVANCIIECRAHNHARRTMSVEDYLRCSGRPLLDAIERGARSLNHEP
jgi:hypothetical protein